MRGPIVKPQLFKQRKRYVPVSVRRELVEASRGRCCLCRQVIIPKEAYFANISTVLERHHIIFFASGGGNESENLVLLCPLCHAIVHEKPSTYTPTYLRTIKAHWMGMSNVVPSVMKFSSSDAVHEKPRNNSNQPVRFSLDSLGLQYVITDIPIGVTVEAFVRFIRKTILEPVNQYDDHQLLEYVYGFLLTHRANKSEIFEDSATLISCPIAEDDAYTIKAQVQEYRDLMPVPMAPLISGVKIRVNPKSPMSGERYVIEVADGDGERAGQSVLFVSVHGTDGYSALYRAAVIGGVSVKISVRSSGAGTVDTVEACAVNDYVDFPGRESLTVIFSSAQTNSPIR